MGARHLEPVVSVYALITKVFLSVLRRYINSIGGNLIVYQLPRYKTTFVLVPISPEGDRWWFFILIASDSKDPWSPTEVWHRICRIYYARFYPWVRGVLGPYAWRYIEGGTIIYVGAISRGCYSFGGKEIDRNVKVYVRDIREFVRWLRTWNPKKIKEFFEDFEKAMEEFCFRLVRQIKSFFVALKKLFEQKAELIEWKSRLKDVEPYGPVKKRITMLRLLSEVFNMVIMYAEGRTMLF